MRQKTLVKIIYLEVIVAVAALIFVLVALWNKPLGPILGLPEVAQRQADHSANSPIASTAEMATQAEATPTPASLLSQIVSLLKPQSAIQSTSM